MKKDLNSAADMHRRVADLLDVIIEEGPGVEELRVLVSHLQEHITELDKVPVGNPLKMPQLNLPVTKAHFRRPAINRSTKKAKAEKTAVKKPVVKKPAANGDPGERLKKYMDDNPGAGTTATRKALGFTQTQFYYWATKLKLDTDKAGRWWPTGQKPKAAAAAA